MSKETGKNKLLALIHIFEAYTDENRGLTMTEIIEKLQEYQVNAERKALYRDISALNDFGYTIKKVYASPVEYRLVDRTFTFAELQLLADSVQSSRFLTKTGSEQLLTRLKMLCSKEQAKLLSARTHVSGRVKMQNESVFKNVDIVNGAMQAHRKISFQYFKFDCKKNPILQHGGDFYIETPVHLVFSDGFYYVIVYNEKHDDFVTYRLDRIKNLTISEEKAVRNEKIAQFDIAEYESRAFGMYSGDPLAVELLVKQDAMGGVIDRFGKDVVAIDKGDSTAEVHVRVMESPAFFGWLAGFGSSVKIVAPTSLAGSYAEYLRSILEVY